MEPLKSNDLKHLGLTEDDVLAMHQQIEAQDSPYIAVQIWDGYPEKYHLLFEEPAQIAPLLKDMGHLGHFKAKDDTLAQLRQLLGHMAILASHQSRK